MKTFRFKHLFLILTEVRLGTRQSWYNKCSLPPDAEICFSSSTSVNFQMLRLEVVPAVRRPKALADAGFGVGSGLPCRCNVVEMNLFLQGIPACQLQLSPRGSIFQ